MNINGKTKTNLHMPEEWPSKYAGCDGKNTMSIHNRAWVLYEKKSEIK
jgi:hypothetical protein